MAEPEVHDLDHLMRICRINVNESSALAGISESNFRRWRNGVSPNMKKFRKLRTAVIDLAIEAGALPDNCHNKTMDELIEIAKGWRV